MSVAAWKAHQDRSVPRAAFFNSDGGSQAVRVLRKYLYDAGLSESRSAADEGFYFARERDHEVTIYYNSVRETRGIALLKCCDALAQRGFALTLFLSARTSALFVRDDG